MAYCTQDDLLKLISENDLAEITAESGGVDAAIVTEGIARADAEIDAYLGVRYTLPLSTTPDRVKGLSVDFAIYHLFTRRNIDEPVRRKRYEDGISFLKDVARGLAEIGIAGTELTGAAQEITEISSSTRVFSRTNMSGW